MAWLPAWKKKRIGQISAEEKAAGSISSVECKQKSKITSQNISVHFLNFNF
jgi:hypothetical protein